LPYNVMLAHGCGHAVVMIKTARAVINATQLTQLLSK
jgi:hypothetical protein